MKTNWNQALHEITEKRHQRTLAEAESDRRRLLDMIAEREAQLDAALAITASKPKASKIKVDAGKSEAVQRSTSSSLCWAATS